jgi:sec-independent protein translocase protein TatC
VGEAGVAAAGGTGKVAIWAAPMGRPTGVDLKPRVSDFVSLFLTMALGFVGAFQVPVVVLLLGWIGVVDVSAMRRYRRYVVVVCAIAGAVLTPSPDPFSMMLMTVPMYGLYELGLLLLWLMPAAKMMAKADESDEESAKASPTGVRPAVGAPSPDEQPGGPADGP